MVRIGRRGWAGLALILVLSLASGAAAGTGLGGSKHDFSRANPKNPFPQAKNACEPCHQYLKTKVPTQIGGITVRLVSTAVCLSCHADTGRPEVGAKLQCTFGRQHPVDVPMPQNPNYQSPEKIPALVFYGPERLVGCTTCHDTHNGKGLPHFLRIVGEGDALCTTCHNF